MSHQAHLAVASVPVPLSLCSDSVHMPVFQMRTLRHREFKQPCIMSEVFSVEEKSPFFYRSVFKVQFTVTVSYSLFVSH